MTGAVLLKGRNLTFHTNEPKIGKRIVQQTNRFIHRKELNRHLCVIHMKNQPIFRRFNSYPKSYSQFYSQSDSTAVEEDNLIANLVFSLYLIVFMYFYKKTRI